MKEVKPNVKLLKVWRDLEPEQKRRFAALVGKSAGSFRHVAEGRRGISSDLAIRIEQACAAMGLRKLNRTDLNKTCRGCEYARTCRSQGLA